MIRQLMINILLKNFVVSGSIEFLRHFTKWNKEKPLHAHEDNYKQMLDQLFTEKICE